VSRPPRSASHARTVVDLVPAPDRQLTKPATDYGRCRSPCGLLFFSSTTAPIFVSDPGKRCRAQAMPSASFSRSATQRVFSRRISRRPSALRHVFGSHREARMAPNMAGHDACPFVGYSQLATGRTGAGVLLCTNYDQLGAPPRRTGPRADHDRGPAWLTHLGPPPRGRFAVRRRHDRFAGGTRRPDGYPAAPSNIVRNRGPEQPAVT